MRLEERPGNAGSDLLIRRLVLVVVLVVVVVVSPARSRRGVACPFRPAHFFS